MAKKGIGIVGYGGFGEFLRRSWNEMPNAEVVAVCDIVSEHLPLDVTRYTDYSQMLADPRIEIVSIATPPSSHKELALQAFAAGKHALVEKPLALTPEDAKIIADAAEQANVKASVNFVLRYNPVVDVISKIVEKNLLGKLRRIDLRNYAQHEGLPKAHWFWDAKISGRILLEHGVHFFDLATAISGEKALDSWSLSVEREPGMQDRVMAVVKYDQGLVGTFWHSFSRPSELERTSLHLAFDLGEIDVSGWIPLEMKIWGWTDKAGLDELKELEVYMSAKHIPNRTAKSSGFDYRVEFEIAGDYTPFIPKQELYADGVRAIMDDLIQSIDNPQHKMNVTLEDAMEAVKTAYLATKTAYKEDE